MKTFDEFLKALENDESLKAKVKEALGGAETENDEAKISALVKLAAENGYNVSTEDFVKQRSEGKELDDEELAIVSGGDDAELCMFDEYCAWTWTCAQVMLSW